MNVPEILMFGALIWYQRKLCINLRKKNKYCKWFIFQFVRQKMFKHWLTGLRRFQTQQSSANVWWIWLVFASILKVTQGIIETNYININIRSAVFGVMKKWTSFNLIKGTFDKQIFDILLSFKMIFDLIHSFQTYLNVDDACIIYYEEV